MGIYADSSKQLIRELIGLTKKMLVGLGYQKLTVAGAVVSLTVPATATWAEITLESSLGVNVAAIRHLELGTLTVPTATDGIAKSHLNVFIISGYQNLINFRAIQTGAGTHTLHIQYFK